MPTLSGNVILKIPSGTQPGTSMRLKGRGMPDLKDKGKHGDLIASIQVQIPNKLTAEQRKLFEQLAKKA